MILGSKGYRGMPKIIFTSPYPCNAPPAQLENYVRYVGTREGEEKIDESKLLLLVTVNQRKLIRQLLRDISASKDMLEYMDFLLHSTIATPRNLSPVRWSRISTSWQSGKTMWTTSQTAPCGACRGIWFIYGCR